MTSPHRTPDWLLERIALGELPPDELAAARARLDQEPDGPSRLAALEA
ncbi:ActD-like protein, partial [Corallococcus sp. CA047B]